MSRQEGGCPLRRLDVPSGGWLRKGAETEARHLLLLNKRGIWMAAD